MRLHCAAIVLEYLFVGMVTMTILLFLYVNHMKAAFLTVRIFSKQITLNYNE